MPHTIYLPSGEAVTLLPDVQEAFGRLICERLGSDAARVYDTLLGNLADLIDDLKAEVADHKEYRHVNCPNCGVQIDLED